MYDETAFKEFFKFNPLLRFDNFKDLTTCAAQIEVLVLGEDCRIVLVCHVLVERSVHSVGSQGNYSY